ncbi:MAG: nitrate reductase molybdenum cofactor assembly chaperone [Planctomycetota bacterium]|jgi:nitrate reductase delta subunit
MSAPREVHESLAALVGYPRENWLADLDAAIESARTGCPGAAEALERLAEWARATPQGELEEDFARTFDNTDERALEVGWHVYGENYTRGAFMAGMRRRLRKVGLEENGELPDHLSLLLPLLSRLSEQRARELALEFVAPATRKVHAALDAMQSPWAPLLEAVIEVLATHAPEARTVAPAVAPSYDPTACGGPEEDRHV